MSFEINLLVHNTILSLLNCVIFSIFHRSGNKLCVFVTAARNRAPNITIKTWFLVKKQSMSKQKLYKASRKPGELLLKTTFDKLKENVAPWKQNIEK